MQSPIVPVPVFPTQADTLIVDSFNGIPLNYRWALAKTIIISPAVPAVGSPGDDNYVPAIPANVSFETLTQGNGSMTDDQWTAWTTQDNSYALICAATNLGVTLRTPISVKLQPGESISK